MRKGLKGRIDDRPLAIETEKMNVFTDRQTSDEENETKTIV